MNISTNTKAAARDKGLSLWSRVASRLRLAKIERVASDIHGNADSALLLVGARTELNLGLLRADIDDYDNAVEIWRNAVLDGQRLKTVDGFLIAARAGFNLGLLHRRHGHFADAETAWRGAIHNALRANCDAGRDVCSHVAVNLGTLRCALDDIDGAREAWELAMTEGNRSNTEDGSDAAIKAAYNLGLLELDQSPFRSAA